LSDAVIFIVDDFEDAFAIDSARPAGVNFPLAQLPP
jgi:hypothetical protein